MDQQSRFAPTTAFYPQAISNWSERVVHQQQPRQPSIDLAMYQMAEEVVSFHQRAQVQDPSDVIASQPQSAGITNVPQASISVPAPQAVYPSALLDPSSTSPFAPFQQQHQHQQQQQGALGGTQGHPQPAAAHVHHDIQVQQRPHSHEVKPIHPRTAHSTSSGSSSAGTVVPLAVSNSGLAASSASVRTANLHIDLGQADPNSPTSHEARLKARSLRRNCSAAPPQHYSHEVAATRGSSSPQIDQAEHQYADPRQPIVPSSRPTTALQTDQYGAQRTFIFNPYLDPNSVPDDGKQGQIPHGVPLPTPRAGASGAATTVVSGASVLAQHQTIEFSGSAESMSPDDLSNGTAIDRNAPGASAVVMGEEEPFLECGFCRQRKIACGRRAPHPRDSEIGEGPRTCNQCARRRILCSFPSESRRGLCKTKPVTKTIIQEDGTEITVVVEDEDEIEELEQVAASNQQSNSKKKGGGPTEWIIAVDAWLITPAAWAEHLADQEKKAAEAQRCTV